MTKGGVLCFSTFLPLLFLLLLLLYFLSPHAPYACEKPFQSSPHRLCAEKSILKFSPVFGSPSPSDIATSPDLSIQPNYNSATQKQGGSLDFTHPWPTLQRKAGECTCLVSVTQQHESADSRNHNHKTCYAKSMDFMLLLYYGSLGEVQWLRLLSKASESQSRSPEKQVEFPFIHSQMCDTHRKLINIDYMRTHPLHSTFFPQNPWPVN